MTPAVSDKILTRKSTAQDDELKAHPPNPPQWGNLLDGNFRIELYAVFTTTDENENKYPPHLNPLPPGERKIMINLKS